MRKLKIIITFIILLNHFFAQELDIEFDGITSKQQLSSILNKLDSIDNNGLTSPFEKMEEKQNMLILYRSKKNKQGEAYILWSIANDYNYNLRKPDSSILIFRDVIQNHLLEISEEDKIDVKIDFASIFAFLDQADSSLLLYHEVLNETNNVLRKVEVLKSISVIYNRLHIDDKAIIYANKAVQLYEKELEFDSSELSLMYFNLSTYYKKVNEQDSAIKFAYKSFNFFNHPMQALLIADLELNRNLEQSKKYLDFVNDTYEVKEMPVVYIFYQITYSQYYLYNGNKDSALYYAYNVINITDSIDDSFISVEVYKNAIEVSLGIQKSFLLDSLIIYQERLQDKEVVNATIDYETKYKTEQKEKALLKERNKILIMRAYILYILFFSVLLLAVGFFLYRNKQAKVNQRILLDEIEKERLKKELSSKISTIVDKNYSISILKSEIENVVKNEKIIADILTVFNQSYISDKEWEAIIIQFDFLNKGFIENLKTKSSSISFNDIKLSILIKLGYSNNSMADILNISYDGVRKAKQRLNKKIESLD